jgi:osmoprotectant transport system permease protein
VNVIDGYTTDARILRDHLVVLDDDLHFFPNYDAVILARTDLEARAPAAWQTLLNLKGTITQEQMIALNSAVEIDGQDFHRVAKDFVAKPDGGPQSRGASTTQTWLQKLFAPDLGRLLFEHLRLVIVAVLAAVVIGVPLGVVASLKPYARVTIVTLTGVLQTIPSLALLAFLIPLLGRIGTVPALVALFLYGLLPIVRNTTVGLLAVPVSLRDAARALGLSPVQRLWLIELPLARRVILAGIKTATVLAIGTATLAALIGAGGFGERITIGLALNDNGLLLAGAIPAAVLALVAEGAFEALDVWLARSENT